jgi:hypothetical protein
MDLANQESSLAKAKQRKYTAGTTPYTSSCLSAKRQRLKGRFGTHQARTEEQLSLCIEAFECVFPNTMRCRPRAFLLSDMQVSSDQRYNRAKSSRGLSG